MTSLRLSKNFLSFRIYSSSINCYSKNQCNTKEKIILHSLMFCHFFLHKSRILVELVETKQNMKKCSSHILMCLWASQAYLSLHWLLQGPPLKIKRCFKTTFPEFLKCIFICTEQTNKHKC